MNNTNNHQSQDPTTTLFYEWLTATFFLGFVFWTMWMYFYFQIGFIKSITLLFDNKLDLIRPFFMMCLFSGGLISAWYFKYIVNDSSKKDKHHRGARRED